MSSKALAMFGGKPPTAALQLDYAGRGQRSHIAVAVGRVWRCRAFQLSLGQPLYGRLSA
jgi:hypothetical protein